jgi:hypothetical protein
MGKVLPLKKPMTREQLVKKLTVARTKILLALKAKQHLNSQQTPISSQKTTIS